jgi:glycosyltransferase involved in cell wall biosynthesis
MNITFCAYDSPTHIGGPNTVLRRLLPALHAQGEHPEALLFHSGGRATGTTAADLQRAGVPVQRIPRPRSTEALLHRVLRASAGTDVFAPDYVAPAYFAARWLRPAGVVTIGAIHGDDPFYDALIDEFVLGPPEQQIDGLMCVSRFLEERVRERIAGRATRTAIRCILPGTIMPAGTAPPPGDDMRIVYVGRLAETHKRATDVARALCLATRAVTGTSGALFGDGPSRRLVHNLLATEGGGLPVRMHGSISGEQVGQELLRSHVLALLSDSEGLGMAVMEAMSCGVVPICMDIPSGTLELVEHNVTGLLVSDRAESFVAAVRRLREEPGLWQRLSRAARERIAERYTPEHSAQQWRTFAAELRERAGPRQHIQIPQHFDLPPVRPSLVHLDERAMPPHRYAARQVRRALGMLRRRLRGG